MFNNIVFWQITFEMQRSSLVLNTKGKWVVIPKIDNILLEKFHHRIACIPAERGGQIPGLDKLLNEEWHRDVLPISGKDPMVRHGV